MNCRELDSLLSSGAALTPEAQAHVSACRQCGELLAALRTHPEGPSPHQIAAIQQRIVSTLKPVRPLPSNGALTLLGLAIFIALSLLVAFPFGYFALDALRTTQKLVYYGVILALAAVFAHSIAEDIIPGPKRGFSRAALIVGAFAALALAVALLFRNFGVQQFVRNGISCLRLGTFGAAVAGATAFLLVRKGFLTTPFETSCLIGTFGGLVGFSVLALHCPIQQASHILVWHLGPILIAACAGAAIGGWITRHEASGRAA